MTDLTTERLAQAVRGRRYEFHAQIDSSNDRAMTLLMGGAPARTVIIADEQTRGRGRLGRAWHSPAGTALMLSYLVRPPVETIGDAGMVGAVAVCEAIQAMGAVNVGVKWPNDVQIDRRKVCGILPESAWKGETLTGVVLGIGINVRVDFGGSPFALTATNLEAHVGRVDRLELLLHLLDRLDFWTTQMGAESLFAKWRGRLNMLGERVSVLNTGAVADAINAAEVSGIAEGVDRDGALRVRGDDGVIRRAIAGDIALGG